MNVRRIDLGWFSISPRSRDLLQMSSPRQWWTRGSSSSSLWLRTSLTRHITHPTPDLQQPKVCNLLPPDSFSAFLPFETFSAMGIHREGPEHLCPPTVALDSVLA